MIIEPPPVDAPLYRRIIGTLPGEEGVILKSVLDIESSPLTSGSSGPPQLAFCDPSSSVSMWAWTDPDSVRVVGRVPGEAVLNVETNALGEVAILSLCGQSMILSTGVWVGNDIEIANSVAVEGPRQTFVRWRGDVPIIGGNRIDPVTGEFFPVVSFELRFPGMDTFGVQSVLFSVDNYCEGEMFASGLLAVDDSTDDRTFWRDPSGRVGLYGDLIYGPSRGFSVAANGHFAYLRGSCGEGLTSAAVGTVDPGTRQLVSWERVPIPDTFRLDPPQEWTGPDIIVARDDGSIVAFLATGSTVLRFEWAPN